MFHNQPLAADAITLPPTGVVSERFLANLALDFVTAAHRGPANLPLAWKGIRRLQQIWQLDLKHWSRQWSHSELNLPVLGVTAQAIMQEMGVVELLVRIWSAVLVHHDIAQGHDDARRVCQHILHKQLEVRNTALATLLLAPDAASSEVAAADRVRRRLERWTDFLLAELHTAQTHASGKHTPADNQANPAALFCYDISRMNDFADDHEGDPRDISTSLRSELARRGLERAFSRELPSTPLVDIAFHWLIQAIAPAANPE